MLIFMPLHTAIPIAMLHGLFGGSTVGIAKRRHADFGELRILAPFVVIGLILGTSILVYVPEKYLLYLLGIFLVCYSCWSLLSPSVNKQIARGWAAPIGIIGGIFSATFGTGGVLFIVFLAGRIRDKETLRATSNPDHFCRHRRSPVTASVNRIPHARSCAVADGTAAALCHSRALCRQSLAQSCSLATYPAGNLANPYRGRNQRHSPGTDAMNAAVLPAPTFPLNCLQVAHP
jgi:hypothetical protein